jgi:hypothetical protein
VAAALGWRFDDEIGERLRRLALAADPHAHAQRVQEDFDEKVLMEELLRDAESESVPRVIETWHPGNLAYARRRSPQVAARFEDVLRAAAQRAPALLVQPLALSEKALRLRQSEPGPDDIARFFLDVGQAAHDLTQEWGLRVAPTIYTDRCSIEEGVSALRGQIE